MVRLYLNSFFGLLASRLRHIQKAQLIMELTLSSVTYRLLWILTAIMSIYSLIYYRREGYLPGGSRAPTNAGVIDPDKEHFSTAPGVEEYAPVHNAEVHDEETGYGGGGHQQPQSDPMRFNRAGYGGYAPAGQDEHTEYMGYGGGGAAASGGGGGRAQFPSANYNV